MLALSVTVRSENLVFSDVFPVAENGAAAVCVALDPAGNMYHAGRFSASADFDPGAGVVNLPHVFLTDIYVSKFDATGSLQWARGVGGMREESAEAIAVDTMGNTYVAGTFDETVDFDPGPGVFELTGTSFMNEVFILKLDPDGVFQWARQLKAQGLDAVKAIAVDSASNVYVAGQFGQTVDFDPGAGTFNLTAAGASNDAYVCKLDTDGNFVWARALGGTSNELIYDIAIDSTGNVVSTGYKFGSPDMDPGPGSIVLPAAGDRDAFVHKMDSSGNALWAVQFAGAGLDQGRGITTDNLGNVYIAGEFRADADFDPGPGTLILPSTGLQSFAAKLDASGALEWAVTTGPGSDYAYKIAVDAAGDVYVTGSLRGTQDFDPGPGVYNIASIDPQYNNYVWHLDTNGVFEWAGVYQSESSMLPPFEALVDGAGGVYTLIGRNNDIDMDPGENEFIVSNPVDQASLIGKLEPQQLPVAIADAGEVDADAVLTMLTLPASTTVLANDTDGNARAVLSVSSADTISAQGAEVTVNPDGTFTYDPTGATALQAVLTGEFVLDSFTYTVSDGTDATIGTVTITVFGKGSGAGLSAIDLRGVCSLMLGLVVAGWWLCMRRSRAIITSQ